jgi:GNAT superfamily N-acetyltransferase
MMTKIPNDKHQAFYEFAEEIDAFLRKRYRYKSQCVHPRHPTIDVGRAAVRLYLRFRVGDSWPVGSIVIAVIGFQDQRRGHGRALLSQLVDMAPRYGYQNIEIEQTGGDASIQAFVRKFGFTNSSDERNWIIPVDQLRKTLSLLTQPSARAKKTPLPA